MSGSHPTRSTHFNEAGGAHMVDITAKSATAREAVASSSIRMNGAAAAAIRAGESRKGDVLAVARLAAIGAAKWTSTLIPLCHAIPIEGVEIDFRWAETQPRHTAPASEASAPHEASDPHEASPPSGESAASDAAAALLTCRATVRTTFKTGVEMEALTAASVATLTVYDMLKSVDRAMVITETRLESKKGGKSGVFSRS